MLSVELTNLADMLDAAHHSKNVSKAARKYSATIKKAIWDTTVVNNIFAYETNGSWLVMLHCLPFPMPSQDSAVATSWTMPMCRCVKVST
jgi:hypothetical protein